MTAKLSGPQLKFCEGILAGLSKAAAYKNAYPRSAQKSAEANAIRLIGKDSVSAYLAEKRKKHEESTGVTREWAINRLQEIADEDDRDRVSAVTQLSKMMGWDKPTKVEHEAGDSLAQLLQQINGKTAGL